MPSQNDKYCLLNSVCVVQELMALVVGNENYNWELLEQNCQYKEGYTPDHPTIQHFWQVFRSVWAKLSLFCPGYEYVLLN